uniref:hypothetical protein n=1 Tax=Candidatus Magnetaquicoccus inordinatus TaxID=2496818 RepID=UPI00102D0FC5
MLRRVIAGIAAILFIIAQPTNVTAGCVASDGLSAIPKYRVYQTAIVAVHGWHSSCREAFGGNGDGHLMRILEPVSFFDFSCFEYNSLDTSTRVPDHIFRFMDHLRKLKVNGYKNVLIITHSTGGILAIAANVNAINDHLLKKRDLSSYPKTVSVMAFATPIVGLR